MFDELWSDPAFLSRFFEYFTHQERFVLAQVCTRWRDILYKPVFWKGIRPVLRCRTLRYGTAHRKLLQGRTNEWAPGLVNFVAH